MGNYRGDDGMAPPIDEGKPIPDNSRALRKVVLKKCREQINEKLEFFIDWGLCVFSLKKVAELPTYSAENDGVPYKITIEWV